MLDTFHYALDIPQGTFLPSFTFSHSFQGYVKEPRWVSPTEAVAALTAAGIKTTKQTLFNMEKRNELKTERISARIVRFNLYEVLEKFKTNHERTNR